MSKSGDKKKIESTEQLIDISMVDNCLPLKKLAEKKKLSFIDNTPDDNSTGVSKQESINKFTAAYNNLNDLSKEYINTLTQVLIDTIGTNNSFEGLVFSSLPEYSNDQGDLTRIDCYNPEKQQINLCLAEKPKIMGTYLQTQVKVMTVFQHEETHAIDDNISTKKVPISIVKLNEFLEKNKDKNIQILLLSAKMINEGDNVLQDYYLKPFIKESNCRTLGDIITSCNINNVNEGAEPKNHDSYAVLLEFVTFHGEKIFEYLKASANAEEFMQQYQNNLDNFSNNMPGTKEDKQLALKLIQVTSEDFLQKVIDTLPTQNISDQEKALKSSLQCLTPALIKSIEQCKEVQQNKDKPSLSSLKTPTSKSSNNPIQTPKAKIDLSNLSTNQEQTLQSAKKVLKNNSALTKRKTSTPKQNNLSKTNAENQNLDNDSSSSSEELPSSAAKKHKSNNSMGRQR